MPRNEGLRTAEFIRRSRLRWVNQLMHPDTSEWNRVDQPNFTIH